MSLPLALVVTMSWEPSGENATCPGVLTNCGVAVGLSPRARFEPGSGTRSAEGHEVALDRAAVQGVQHVDQVAVDGHADREGPAGADHLAEGSWSPLDGEHRDGVAAGVDRVEQVVLLVVGQRALRGQMVDDRTGQDPAEPAGVVGAGLGERPVGRAAVGDDLVAGGVVGLHEDCGPDRSRGPAGRPVRRRRRCWRNRRPRGRRRWRPGLNV